MSVCTPGASTAAAAGAGSVAVPRPTIGGASTAGCGSSFPLASPSYAAAVSGPRAAGTPAHGAVGAGAGMGRASVFVAGTSGASSSGASVPYNLRSLSSAALLTTTSSSTSAVATTAGAVASSAAAPADASAAASLTSPTAGSGGLFAALGAAVSSAFTTQKGPDPRMLHMQNATLQAQLNQLTQELEEEQRKVGEAVATAARETARAASLASSLEDARSELAEARESLAAESASLSAAEARAKEAEDRAAAEATGRKTAEAEAQETSAALAAASEAASAAAAEHRSAVASLIGRIAADEDRLARLEGQLSVCRGELASARESLASSEAQLASTSASLEALSAEHAALRAVSAEDKASIAGLEAAAEEAAASIASLQAEVASVRAEIVAQAARLAAEHEASIAELRSRTATAETRAAEAEKTAHEASKAAEIADRRYVNEQAERRRVFAKLQETRGNIRVVVRIRPALPKEVAAGEGDDPAVVPVSPYELIVPEAAAPSERVKSGRVLEEKRMEFDYVFGPGSTQEEVFDEVAGLVTSALDGFHCCIFACESCMRMHRDMHIACPQSLPPCALPKACPSLSVAFFRLLCLLAAYSLLICVSHPLASPFHLQTARRAQARRTRCRAALATALPPASTTAPSTPCLSRRVHALTALTTAWLCRWWRSTTRPS